MDIAFPASPLLLLDGGVMNLTSYENGLTRTSRDVALFALL